MRFNFLFLFLLISCFGLASATVYEYNYFKYGQSDVSGNLIPTSTSLAGVGVTGFTCSDSTCSGNWGTLWNNWYSSGIGINLVYPTVLASSYGYGYWVYKDGYIPYYVKGTTYSGEGTAPARNVYLSRKTICSSSISVSNIDQDGSSLSFDVSAGSPMLKLYGNMYVPSVVSGYLYSLVDVNFEVKDSSGDVVWSETKQKNIAYGQSGSVSFSKNFADGDYTAKVWTSSYNEDQCLSVAEKSYSFNFNVDTYDNDKDDDGYTEDVDCNDYDASVWQFLSGYVDSDDDGWGVNPLVDVCSGNSLPSGYSSKSGDCDDSDSDVWRFLFGYVDNDLDSYGSQSGFNVCVGNSLPSGYSSNDDDCNDNNFNINPSVSEVCGDGIDNDCDGSIDEGCALPLRVVSVTANPFYGAIPLDVLFNCVAEGGEGDLDYYWDFDNGDFGDGSSLSYTYEDVGEFNVSCRVEDSSGDEAFGYVDVETTKGSLDIVELTCFDEVVVGHNQSCSVFVEDGYGSKVGGVDVEIFYDDGSLFGECVTNFVSGACSVKDLQENIGSFEVYAVASKDNFFSDDDEDPKFSYEVFDEEYNIVDLKVFNDSGFSKEDYDFFRGEDLFVSFVVEDLDGDVVLDDLVSKVTLVSSVAGGRVDLDFVDFDNGVYYYELIPVPITHDFLGDSNVFSFVFDLDGVSGQEEVSLVIRNNLPYVSPAISDKEVDEGDSINIDLENHENDVEDSGDDLIWEIISFGSKIDVDLNGKVLKIRGLDEGSASVVLRLYDLDLDYDEVSFNVDVEDGGSSGGGGSSEDDCDNRWDCSSWSACEDGVMTRICEDLNDCRYERNKPAEILSCSDSGVSSDMVYLGDFSASDDKGVFNIWDYSYWIIGFLILLILLAIILIFLRL